MSTITKKIIFLLSSFLFFTSEKQLSAAGQGAIEEKEQEEDCSNEKELSLPKKPNLLLYHLLSIVVVGGGVIGALIYYASTQMGENETNAQIYKRFLPFFLDIYNTKDFFSDKRTSILERGCLLEDEIKELWDLFPSETASYVDFFRDRDFDRKIFAKYFFPSFLCSKGTQEATFDLDKIKTNPELKLQWTILVGLTLPLNSLNTSSFFEAFSIRDELNQRQTSFVQSFQNVCAEKEDHAPAMSLALLHFALLAKIDSAAFLETLQKMCELEE